MQMRAEMRLRWRMNPPIADHRKGRYSLFQGALTFSDPLQYYKGELRCLVAAVDGSYVCRVSFVRAEGGA